VYLQFLVLLLCALYGSVFTFGKLALEYAPPLFITGSRMLLAGFLLLGYQFCFNRAEFRLQKQDWLPIFMIALTGVYLTNALEFWGLQFMETGKACFLYSFCPVATALMSYVWFKEKITTAKWIGLTIAVIGFIPILISDDLSDFTFTLFFLSLAEAALLGAAVATSLGWLTMREIVKKRNFSAVMANGASMIIGGALALGHSWMVEPWDPFPVSNLQSFLPWFLCLTLVSNLICYNLHAYLLRSFTATYISFAGLSQPFFTALFGFLFLDEILSPYFWASAVPVTVGLYIYYQQELKLGHAPVRKMSAKSTSTKFP
jgi:drug/metabolite transporter (DMT)-like permease